MRCTTNTTTMRERGRRVSPHPHTIASCWWTRARTYCRDQEEQLTQRASFAATYHTRVHHSSSGSSRSSSWWARMLGLKQYHVKLPGTSLRRQTRVSQRRFECLSLEASEVHSARRQTFIAVGDVGFTSIYLQKPIC